MKTIFQFLIFIFLITSCQTEDISQEGPQNIFDTSAKRKPIAKQDDALKIFENRMQWASFITAEVLIFDEASREQIEALLNTSSGRSIAFDDLVGPKTKTSGFHKKFVDRLQYYVTSPAWGPDHQQEHPDYPVVRNINPNLLDPEILVEEYLDYMLNQRCVELYFPKDLQFHNRSYHLGIASTADPLNGAQENTGYIVYFDVVNNVWSEQVTVNLQFMLQYPNIIIARPKHVSGVSNCQY